MDKRDELNHPAKFNNKFIPIFAEKLKGYKNVLDPFAGTGKIGEIKNFGYSGLIYCNEIEHEWCDELNTNVDVWTSVDSEFLEMYENDFFESICTSPTYGNRMADNFKIPDKNSGRKYVTYMHYLGRKLTDGNTGSLQWGDKYKTKHKNIYEELYRVLKKDGLLIINIANHIRKGEEIDVSKWTKNILLEIGFSLQEEIKIETQKMRYGSNNKLRVPYEFIFIFKK